MIATLEIYVIRSDVSVLLHEKDKRRQEIHHGFGECKACNRLMAQVSSEFKLHPKKTHKGHFTIFIKKLNSLGKLVENILPLLLPT